MEHYNLRSGSFATAVVSSSSEIQDSGRTEESRLANFAVRDAPRLAAEGVTPNLMESVEILPLQNPWDGDFSAPRNPRTGWIVRSPGRSCGAWFSYSDIDRVTACIVVGYGVHSFGWELGYRKEYDWPPVLHPFCSSPSLAAAYAIQDSSASTSMLSQVTQQSVLSL